MASVTVGPTAPHEPTHTYIPNRGYEQIGEFSTEQQYNGTSGTPAEANLLATDYSDGEDDDFYDSESDAFEEDALARSNPADYTKAYNRERALHDMSIPESQKPKTNPQKPKANLHASIDDKIAALSHHASKIKLDDRAAGFGDRGARIVDKSDRATYEQVLDPRTRMILLKLINRNIVSEIHGCVSTGKEANVYYAEYIPYDEDATLYRAVKVYKTSILVFKDREKYVTGEHRFKRYNKSSNWKMVTEWAMKEFRNLNRLYSAGIPTPEPIHIRNNVLVMGFLGDKKGYPAPRLKDVVFEDEDPTEKWKSLYTLLLSYMRIMYQTCKLVHADLSEYNLLYYQDKLWVIDVSQSVEHDQPRSLEFLRMDIKNVSSFFKSRGVDTLAERAVFGFIIAPEGGVEPQAMLNTLWELYKQREEKADAEGDEALAAEIEIENEVFRQQFIPQTLQQVYDYERDAEKVKEGQVDDLVYQALLAQKVANPDAADGAEGEEEEEDEIDEDSDDEGGTSLGRENDRPRGKRFEDKDAKKEHKRQVKEEKREKRKNKIPKHVKKRLIKESSKSRR